MYITYIHTCVPMPMYICMYMYGQCNSRFEYNCYHFTRNFRDFFYVYVYVKYFHSSSSEKKEHVTMCSRVRRNRNYIYLPR